MCVCVCVRERERERERETDRQTDRQTERTEKEMLQRGAKEDLMIKGTERIEKSIEVFLKKKTMVHYHISKMRDRKPYI